MGNPRCCCTLTDDSAKWMGVLQHGAASRNRQGVVPGIGPRTCRIAEGGASAASDVWLGSSEA
jgi:hypothetical protein